MLPIGVPGFALSAALLAVLARRAAGGPARRLLGAGVVGAGGGDRHSAWAVPVEVVATAATLLVAVLAASPGVALALPIVLFASRAVPRLSRVRQLAARRARLEAQVPELVDLMVVATEAGAGLAAAISRASALVGDPLGEELRAAVGVVALGTPWRVALERLAEGAPAPSLRRLVAAVTRSQRLGTPVAGALRSLAADLRAERRARAEEAARRAPVKMLFPLVLLILPAFLLLTVGPVLLATIRSLR